LAFRVDVANAVTHSDAATRFRYLAAFLSGPTTVLYQRSSMCAMGVLCLLFFEPGADGGGVVAEVAAGWWAGAVFAPLVERFDGDSEVPGDVVDIPEVFDFGSSQAFLLF